MPPSIHPWLGEFTDPALEEAYRQRHLRSQWRRAELGTGVVVAIWTCYIGLDALLYPEVAAATFPWRVLFLVYTVPAMVLARRWPERVTDLTTVGMVVYATSLALA